MTLSRPIRVRSLRVELIVTVAGLLALWLMAPRAILAPDDMVHLVWGSQLIHGETLEMTGSARPTPHPLETVLAMPLALLGEWGDDGLRVVSLLALVSAGVATARIGATLFNLPVGVLAGVLLVSRPHMIELAQHGDPGILALAFVTWAGAVAVRRPRHDALVLVLLAAGGLLRPEVWALTGGFVLWVLWRDRRPRPVLALALLGPLLWVLHDWLGTGKPLWSFTQTQYNTRAVPDETGLRAVVDLLPSHLGYLLALPALITGVIGFVAGLAFARRRTVAIAVTGALVGITYVAFAVAKMWLLPRYLIIVAAVICLLAAIGVLGWWSLSEDDPWRARWRIAGLAAALILVVGVPWDLAKHEQVRTALQDDGPKLEDLLARAPVRDKLDACRPVHVTSPLGFAYAAYWSGMPLTAFTIPPAPPEAARALITPTARTVSDVAQRPAAIVAPPPGFKLVTRTDEWEIYARC